MSIAPAMERPAPRGVLPLQDLSSKLATVEVVVSRDDARTMDDVVAAVHQVVATPAYQAASLAWAPEIARESSQRVSGLFSGFDFHITPEGPKLIEINTNAGGAFYAALIDDMQFQRGQLEAKPLGHWSKLFVEHFRTEWALAGNGQLRTVAIIDDTPDEQFLRLEYHLASQFLREAGVTVIIADPGELSFHGNRLWHAATPIDLVYNRLTSFALDREIDRPLYQALRERAAVITPDPRNHALLACKRNLTLLSDNAFLCDAGLDARAQALLAAAIPRTIPVTLDNAAELWSNRDAYYFKPVNGYGSRGVYAGAKLTLKTWNEIFPGGQYVAQSKIEPPRIDVPGSPAMRYDVRSFTFGGKSFMRVARVYRGQTTNFRTPGGGFAPVFVR